MKQDFQDLSYIGDLRKLALRIWWLMLLANETTVHNRVKTDKRDALKLPSLLEAGRNGTKKSWKRQKINITGTNAMKQWAGCDRRQAGAVE